MTRRLAILTAALLLAATTLQAKVTFPSVISDNMVLQQQTAAALWGKAEPGRKVTVQPSWTKTKTVTTADPQSGKWEVRLATPAAGGPYEITVSDGEAVTLRNVMVGEVWYCSGQSNMEMPMRGYTSQPAKGATDFILSANESRPIRICNITKKNSATELEESQGSWKTNTPDAVATISATAYYFAEYLQKVLGVPVGILVTCWGGSTIEAWLSREVMERDFPEFDLSFLNKEIPKNDHYRPTLLYNGQVAPVVPYTFKGMIWYQGESNRSIPKAYIKLQKAYVEMMREKFNVPEAPFYFVQIAPYPYDNPDSFMSGYFYEAQQKSLSVIPNSGMAVTCDVGEYGTIHPCQKETVGKRLAYLALNHDYGYKIIEADAPTYKSVKFENGKAKVSFNVGNRGLSPIGAEISGFEIAGEDKVFHPAKATFEEDDNSIVTVSSEEVANPVAVRYCFRNWCVGGLYNNFGIPAAPFRTDNWDL